jgi:hypothetical protein
LISRLKHPGVDVVGLRVAGLAASLKRFGVRVGLAAIPDHRFLVRQLGSEPGENRTALRPC